MLIPLLAIVGEWGENFGILAMLSVYPERLPTVAVVSNTFTKLKYVSTFIPLVVVVVGLVMLGVTKLRHARQPLRAAKEE